ncbi:hypothetical protein OIU77_010282 [Salix suchowensis]|uniref:Uncharacterized protein n=1 Tax=Salix suchowensis TaxID=1278906 RepID=A0ABQ9A900_9ROSI|nr:hypothetical protein OIU77_010282 [Salix suchowensis]
MMEVGQATPRFLIVKINTGISLQLILLIMEAKALVWLSILKLKPLNELPAVDSPYNVTSFDLANQNLNVLLAADSASNFVSESRHMTFDPANQTPSVLLTADNSASNVSGSHYMAFDLANKIFVSEKRHMTFDLANNSISMLASENSLMASRGSEILEPPFPFPLEGESGNSMVMSCSFINQSTYDKSEPSSLTPSDFDYQNQSKEIDISAFDEGVWSNITATAPDFVNQNPCKKPDMSAALEEDYSSYSEPFFSYSYLADDLSLSEVNPGLQAGIEGCFEEENIPNPAHFQLPAVHEENPLLHGRPLISYLLYNKKTIHSK